MLKALLAGLALWAATPQPAAVTANRTVLLATYSKRELRAPFHMVIAGSIENDLHGAILRPNGTRACTFSGYITLEGCFYVLGCGQSGVVCP